jgi:hypothetical protein
VGVIDISQSSNPPQCQAQHYPSAGHPGGVTGIWVEGTTSEDLDNLTYSSNLSVGTGVGGAEIKFEPNPGKGTFKINATLAEYPDTSLCPISVVIQAKDGAIAVSPVIVQEFWTP